MQVYEHGGDIYGNQGVTLDFSVNTNPLGMPEAVRAALLSRVDEFASYPDPHYRELRAAISAYENVPEDHVICGNGAADLIYRLCYAAAPRTALVCAPTFSEYEKVLLQAGCQVKHHFLSAGNQFSLTDEFLSRLTRGIDMLFLCHPSNPTGRLITPELMERILERTRENNIRIVVDECFLDFTEGVSCKKYLDDMPLVVLKAFTKMYSIAGLRLGYLLSSCADLNERVNAAAQCWSVSVPAQIAGLAALSVPGWQEETRRLIAKERRFLSESLSALGLEVFPSDANFLLFCTEHGLYEPLLLKGILIRRCGNFKGLNEHYYRIGIKTRPDNARLIEVIQEIILS